MCDIFDVRNSPQIFFHKDLPSESFWFNGTGPSLFVKRNV